jgi:hypothetical protein
VSQGKKEKEEGVRGVQGGLQGVLLGLQAASRRWLANGPAQDTQVCCLLEEEERRVLQKTPWGLEDFLDKIKIESFAIFGTSNGVQKLGNLAGAFKRNSRSSTNFICKLLGPFECKFK